MSILTYFLSWVFPLFSGLSVFGEKTVFNQNGSKNSNVEV